MSVNFPTSADDGTSLIDTRTTGQAIPPSDHNDLADAIIAVETKIGYGASTPVTAGQVLTVSGVGQSTWQAAPWALLAPQAPLVLVVERLVRQAQQA